MLSGEKDLSNLDNCVQLYKEIVASEHISSTTTRIHNLISRKKEEHFMNEISNNVSKDSVLKMLEEIKLNKWNISQPVLKILNDFIAL